MLPPRGGAGGQRPDEGGHPPLHAPRSSPDEAFREGEAPSETVRWACAVRTPSRWAASAVETPSRLSRPPRNTVSPSGPSAPQTTLSATAETAACGVPLAVALGNEGLPGGCCDRGCGQLETPWPISKCHRKPLEENVLWHLMWVRKQRVAAGRLPLPGSSVPGGRGSVRAGPLGVRCSKTAPMGRSVVCIVMSRVFEPWQGDGVESRSPRLSDPCTRFSRDACTSERLTRKFALPHTRPTSTTT